MKEIPAHPAAEIFPMMEPSNLKQLAMDIKEQGLMEPIVLFEGKILDGRNRYQACLQVGVKPKFIEVDLDGGSALEFVLSKNLHRRHLSTAQRAALALTLLPELSEQARQRMRFLGKGKGEIHPELPPEVAEDKGEAVEKAAALVGLGHSTVEKAVAIQKRTPDVIEKMLSGEIKTVDAARRASGMMATNDGPITDNAPRIYYGKGDRWREATLPLVRYLHGWEKRGFEFRHVNHIEARRRLKLIDETIELLSAAKGDLEKRSIKAQTRMTTRGR